MNLDAMRLEDVPMEYLRSEAQLESMLDLGTTEPLKSDIAAFLRGEPTADAGAGWLHRAIRQERHDLIHRLHAQGVKMDVRCVRVFFWYVNRKSLTDLIPLLFEKVVPDEFTTPEVASFILCDASLAMRFVPYLGTALFNQANAGKVAIEACQALDGYGMRFDDPVVVDAIIKRLWHMDAKQVDGARFLITRCPEAVPMFKLRGLYWGYLARKDELPEDPVLVRALVDPSYDLDRLLDSAVDVYSKVHAIVIAGRMRVLEISEQERKEARRVYDITQNIALRNVCAL